MSWVRPNVKYSIFEWLYMRLVKFGDIPKHVAIIMDGNRRYANQRRMNTINGHQSGFEKLSHVLSWCHDLSIKELSVYAFSNANFNRSKDEVDYLMDLAYEKFKELYEKLDKVNEYGVCIRIIGDLSRLPNHLSSLVAKLMLETRNNKEAVLNIFMAYTSTDEIVECMNSVIGSSKLFDNNRLEISSSAFNACMQSFDIRPIDLLIRTSGETRLSDFLTWQLSRDESVYEFVDKMWPEFTVIDFCSCILQYQMSTLSKLQLQRKQSINDYTELIEQKRLDDLKKFSKISALT